MELPKDLRDALEAAVTGVAERVAVARLIEIYRAGGPAAAPIVGSVADAAAYAAYRMPATFAAVRVALAALHAAAPQLRPASHLDLGGGTGAAAWAATEQFPTLSTVTVVDQAPHALGLGRRLAINAASPALREASWRRLAWRGAAWASVTEEPAPLGPADLVTISYVIGELPEADALLLHAAQLARVLVVIEPGTPAGFERIRAARTRLLEAGLRVVAPCPHQEVCPIVSGRDWCHFPARIGRSSLHRRLKGGELSYEDEKFAYVAAVRAAGGSTPGRVLRRPQHRKGLVSMSVCAADGTIRTETVSKRMGELYRSARDAGWGGIWPPG